MATKNVLAFDLGASSGRGMLARFDGEKITLEEVHRFEHNFSTLHGHAYWNFLSLMDAMKTGMRKSGDALSGVGFDTWGVDCGLLNREGDLVGMPGSYRDAALDDENMRKALMELSDLHPGDESGVSVRAAMEQAVANGEKYAFEQTGIASLAYNTLYKLYYMQKHMPSMLEQTDKILMLPNLIEYFFSGVKHTEYSIASTTQLYNMQKKCWAEPLMAKLNIPKRWFTDVDLAGKDLGVLRSDVAAEVGQKGLHIISAPGHDTACAVAAVPAKEDQYTFLSCGTWSLMGISSQTMLKGPEIIRDKISNEGTWDGGYRPTVNIIGLWMQNEIKRNFAAMGREYSFKQLAQMAEQEKPLQSFIRPDDFMQPGDYPTKIREYCKQTNQPVPATDGALIRCILESLAMKYRQVYLSLKPYITWEEKLYMVGGGAQNPLLRQYTANALGIPVITGASEATAVGNVMAQLKALGCYETSQEKCDILAASFETRELLPQDTDAWDAAYERFQALYQ
ncbi:MAG: FGGY-family carbohydrate kinase [Eubacteriales bacterium]|nr:FGGY-family carbohydrate kinase [Eubacteriales bacterium]